MSAVTVLVFMWAIPVAVSHGIGKRKNRLGAMYGLFLSWLGVLIVAVLPPLHGAEAGEVKCPDCAEWVKGEARVCRYCGAKLAAG